MTKKEGRAKKAAYMREYRLKHLDQERLRDRVRYVKQRPNRRAVAERSRLRRILRHGWSAARKRHRNAWLKCMYGITERDFRQMVKRQHGRCAICHKVPKRYSYRALHVDHNHKTKQVRGLLCHACNVSLHAIERPTWLRWAQAYLRKAQEAKLAQKEADQTKPPGSHRRPSGVGGVGTGFQLPGAGDPMRVPGWPPP